MINDRANKLEHFILDILEFSKNVKDELAITSVSANELVDEIAESLRYMGALLKSN